MKNKLHNELVLEKERITKALEKIGYSPFGFEIIEIHDDWYTVRISGMKTKDEERGRT
jgi:hypothetical protein